MGTEKINLDIATIYTTRRITSILLIFAVLFFHGCASHVNVKVDETSINYGIPTVVQMGEVIAEESMGEVEVKRNWVGIMNSDDGWSEPIFFYSDDYMERKLYYQGISDSVIHLIYQEYEQGEEEPTLNKTLHFDLNESLYFDTAPYYLRVDDIAEASITLTLLDKQTWIVEHEKFQQDKEQLAKEQQLLSIIQISKNLISEANAAKTYVDNFVNVTPNFSSYAEASTYYISLRQRFDTMLNGSTQSHDELMRIHTLMRDEFAELNQHFVQVATALEKWDFLDKDLTTLTRAVGNQQFLEGAIALKKAGETALLAEDFSKATEYFTMSSRELKRLREP